MTALHLVYLASIAGAVLFFVAGAATMWSRGGRGAQPHEAELREALANAERFAHQQQAHRVELERELARTRSTAATHAQRTSAEVERASAEVERVGTELERARAETVSLRARLELAAQQFALDAGTKEVTTLRGQPARGADK